MSAGLTAAQRTMLTGAFYIDGWHNKRFLGEANDLVSRGFLTVRDGSDDQRTVFHFEPVADGAPASTPDASPAHENPSNVEKQA